MVFGIIGVLDEDSSVYYLRSIEVSCGHHRVDKELTLRYLTKPRTVVGIDDYLLVVDSCGVRLILVKHFGELLQVFFVIGRDDRTLPVPRARCG